MGTSRSDLNKFNMLKELQSINGQVGPSNSQQSVSPSVGADHSEETIKKIYTGALGKRNSSRSYSAHTQVSTLNLYIILEANYG